MELVTGHRMDRNRLRPMFSGKRRRTHSPSAAPDRSQACASLQTPIDNPYSEDEIVSHGDQRMKSDASMALRNFCRRLD